MHGHPAVNHGAAVRLTSEGLAWESGLDRCNLLAKKKKKKSLVSQCAEGQGLPSGRRLRRSIASPFPGCLLVNVTFRVSLRGERRRGFRSFQILGVAW